MHCASLAILTLKLCIVLPLAATAQGMSVETKAWCARVVPILRETLKVDPKESARRAANKGDLRYLEWYGFASAIPGVKSQACVRARRLSKPFEGTSDALCSEEHRELYEKSHSYAEAFNQQMAMERRRRTLVSCDDA